MSNFIPIGNRKVPGKYIEIPHLDLEFYTENPRIYSLVRKAGETPSQEEIEETLVGMSHVKQLKKEIQQFGGLAEPIYVRDGKIKTVLEGNSRLAAYRLLSRENPIKWGKMRCFLLNGISDNEIFALLGILHIQGKKDWDPFEQAGYFYRRHKNQGVSKTELGQQLSMSPKEVGKLIQIYEFMLEKGLPSKQFSYIDVYLRNSKIKSVREDHSEFDDLIIEKFKLEEIPEARAVRDHLPKICEKGGKTLKKFMQGKITFEEAVEASSGGDYEKQIKKFKDFYNYLLNTQEEIISAPGESKAQCKIVLKRIEQCLKGINKKLKE